MASPQKENGYVAIANELFDALARTRIAGEPRQIIDVIFRKTYGFNKKEDSISITQFQLATGLGRTSVQRAISKAIALNICSKKATGKAISYSINKDFDSWNPVAKKIHVAKKLQTSSENATKVYPKSVLQKTVTKDIFKDIGESSENATRAYAPGIHEMILWAESRMGHRFPDKPKQAGALAKIFAAKYRPEQVRECWENLERDEYWGVQGFDFRAVVSEIGKARGSQEIYSLVRKK